MTLLELLVEKLPKNGGWPAGAVECVRFVDEATIDFYDEHGNWPDDCSLTYGPIAKAICITPTEPCQRESVKLEEYESALAARKPEWDGKGLPPVGCEFEYQRFNFGADEGTWVKCVMKYAGDKVCVVHLEGEGESWLKHEGTKFRPIRSEEDKRRDDNGLVDGYDVHYWSALAKERFHKYNELETEIIEVRRMLTGFYKDLKSGMKFYKIVTDEDE